MTYIVNSNCIKCKLTDCVEVCPVDCFYEGENMLVIDPDVCIDCGICEPECPIEAIVSDSDLDNRFYDAVPYLQKLKSIAKENKLTLAELSLLWLVSLEEVSKVIIGVNNSDQLKMHLATVNKNVNLTVFKEALSIHYENENILNPSLWPTKS